VSTDAVEPAPVGTRHRHVDHGLSEVDQAPEGSCVAVAEERFGTTGDYGGHPLAEAVECRRSERVDALTDPVKLPALDPATNRVSSDPNANHLPRGHGTMLPRCEPHQSVLQSQRRR
jgi:hypothetical protein